MRLGGNEKVGAFATRSPFRPNRIGLSVCRLTGIDYEDAEGPILDLEGVDLVDGTPVLDVKPYLPYVDSVEATGAFASERPTQIEVRIASSAQKAFEELPVKTRELIRETLALDPRPAFHRGDRSYFLLVDDLEVVWTVREGECEVMEIRTAAASD